MSIIQTAINDLVESDKDPSSCGHDVRFYFREKQGAIYISTGLPGEYPIYLYLEKEDLNSGQEDVLKLIKLKNSKNQEFTDFEKIRYSAQLELNREYIEELISIIFKKVFDCDSLADLQYDINPV